MGIKPQKEEQIQLVKSPSHWSQVTTGCTQRMMMMMAGFLEDLNPTYTPTLQPLLSLTPTTHAINK